MDIIVILIIIIAILIFVLFCNKNKKQYSKLSSNITHISTNQDSLSLGESKFSYPPRFYPEKINVTPYGADRLGGVLALTNQFVDCSNSGIQSFFLERDAPNNMMRYNYMCANGIESSSGVQYFETQPALPTAEALSIPFMGAVKCSDDSIITNFKMIPQETAIKYAYGCLKSDRPLICREDTTSMRSYGPNKDVGDVRELDKHHIVCNVDEVITSFEILRPNSEMIQYKYTCCKYQDPRFPDDLQFR